MVTGVLGIENVLVDDKGGATRFRSVAYAYLSNGSKFAEYVVHLVRGDFVRQVPHVQ